MAFGNLKSGFEEKILLRPLQQKGIYRKNESLMGTPTKKTILRSKSS
jgi:hypothetical protein